MASDQTSDQLLSHLHALSGQTFGPSAWVTVPQATIDGFAELTGDRQWLHVDPARAARESPFAQTVAHGMFTLSLLPELALALVPLQGARSVINYGLERVRFPAPVLSGSKVRLWVEVAEVMETPQGAQIKLSGRFENDQQEKPVCVAQILLRVELDQSPRFEDA